MCIEYNIIDKRSIKSNTRVVNSVHLNIHTVTKTEICVWIIVYRIIITDQQLWIDEYFGVKGCHIKGVPSLMERIWI